MQVMMMMTAVAMATAFGNFFFLVSWPKKWRFDVGLSLGNCADCFFAVQFDEVFLQVLLCI